jgi:hypothetical protein
VLYFANPSTAPVRKAMATGPLGVIVTPAQGNRLPDASLFCIDNGCGPGKDGQPGTGYPGDEAYLALLQSLATDANPEPCDPDMDWCLFAVAPDVVGDAAATLRRSGRMLDWIRYAGFRAALVGQNGLEDLPVPWDDFDALFLGGSAECPARCGYVRPLTDTRTVTRCPRCHRRLAEWKLGPAARALTAQASRRGKHVHMGRVNSLKRLRYAAAIGCDSADGTYLANGPDVNLPAVLAWLRDVNIDSQTRPPLFDIAARPA